MDMLTRDDFKSSQVQMSEKQHQSQRQMPSRPRSVKIIKKIVKKKTYSVSALPKSEEMQGKSPNKTLGVSRHQTSTHTLYEVKTIKIDRSGTRSVLTSKSIDDQPKEVRDFSNSM